MLEGVAVVGHVEEVGGVPADEAAHGEVDEAVGQGLEVRRAEVAGGGGGGVRLDLGPGEGVLAHVAGEG